jgi:hypothetical protein
MIENYLLLPEADIAQHPHQQNVPPQESRIGPDHQQVT